MARAKHVQVREYPPVQSYRDELPRLTDEDNGARKPDFLLKVKDIRPGRASRWVSVGAAWSRVSNKTGDEFFSITLNPCVTLTPGIPLCMYRNDGTKSMEDDE